MSIFDSEIDTKRYGVPDRCYIKDSISNMEELLVEQKFLQKNFSDLRCYKHIDYLSPDMDLQIIYYSKTINKIYDSWQFISTDLHYGHLLDIAIFSEVEVKPLQRWVRIFPDIDVLQINLISVSYDKYTKSPNPLTKNKYGMIHFDDMEKKFHELGLVINEKLLNEYNARIIEALSFDGFIKQYDVDPDMPEKIKKLMSFV